MNNNKNKQSQDNSSDSLRVNTKETQPNIKPDFKMPQYKLQMKIPYINAFYFGRTDLYFRDIDNFRACIKRIHLLLRKNKKKIFLIFIKSLHVLIPIVKDFCFTYILKVIFLNIFMIFSLHKINQMSL